MYFEELNIGDKVTTRSRTITETDLVLFTNLMGFVEPMFIDEEWCKRSGKSVFGTRVFPGAFSLSITAGLIQSTELSKGGLAMVGLNNIKFIAPLKPGDTVSAEAVVISKKESSNPGRGVLTFKERLKNQRGDIIVEYERVDLHQRRPKVANLSQNG